MVKMLQKNNKQNIYILAGSLALGNPGWSWVTYVGNPGWTWVTYVGKPTWVTQVGPGFTYVGNPCWTWVTYVGFFISPQISSIFDNFSRCIVPKINKKYNPL